MYRFLLSCLAGAGLLAACQQEPPDPFATTLRFDERYRDSIFLADAHSPATLRQRAIYRQLERLHSARKCDSLADCGEVPAGAWISDPIPPWVVKTKEGYGWELTDSCRTFPDAAAYLADIRPKIDSLEALERTSPLPR